MFPAESRVSDSVLDPNLISDTPFGFIGKFVEELPGFFNWINGLSKEIVYDTLKKPYLLSTAEFAQITENETNPILRWAKEEIEKGNGSFLGCKMNTGLQGEQDFQLRKPLYPAYERWSRREGVKALSPKLFSFNIIDVFTKLGYIVRKERKTAGIYIHGIKLKDEIFSRDYILGAEIPSIPEIAVEHPSPYIQSSTSISPINKLEPNFLPSYSGDQLYENYFLALGSTEKKVSLNKVSRTLSYNLDELANAYCQNCSINSPSYLKGVHSVLDKGLRQIHKFGAIPFVYKQMGVSPRIVPVSYRDSIQSLKKYLRTFIYKDLSGYLNSTEYVILDLDLKSCYISILLGLYPNELTIVQQAIEGKGLWAYIQSEFEHQGKGNLYNKALAKICVYSSLFQGGNKAMSEGILEHFRKEVGLSPKEFRDSDIFHDVSKITQDTVYFLNNSNIINSFRALSHFVKNKYRGSTLYGPTKHEYPVNESTFRSSFPNYLQSYEFFLIANSVLHLRSQDVEFELLGHFHDGIVVAIPKKRIDQFSSQFEQVLDNYRIQLGLIYPIRIETSVF
jgi:hypothetical protein